VKSSEQVVSLDDIFCTNSTSVDVGRGNSLHQWIYMPHRLTPCYECHVCMYGGPFSPGQQTLISQEAVCDTTATST